MQVKYDLGDWERRKAGLLPILEAAAVEGLLARGQIGRLGDFLLGRGVTIGAAVAPPAPSPDAGALDQPIAAEPVAAVEESEAPRFIRGFHDILITIGIIVLLSGLAGLATIYAVIPACIVLAEILVRRQRLALPAVVLTIAFGTATSGGLLIAADEWLGLPDDWLPVLLLGTVAAVLFLFFWRYKAPIALAGGFVTGFAAAVLTLAMLVVGQGRSYGPVFDRPLMLALFLGLFALLVFGTALYHDMADRFRITRRSDVAFWMHLAAAPAILYTILALVYVRQGQGWFSMDTSATQAGAIFIAVLALMLIGIVLDRRAFVTSGLVSFGYAFKVLLTEGGFDRFIQSTDTLAFVILFAIGLLVLGLGIGWQPLRRRIVTLLPDAVQLRVPPVRG